MISLHSAPEAVKGKAALHLCTPKKPKKNQASSNESTDNKPCLYVHQNIHLYKYVHIYIIIYLLYITILFPKFKFSYFESSQANVIFHVLMLTSIVDRTNLNTVSSILHWFSFQVLPAPSLLHNWSRLQNSFDDILFMFLLENLISFAYSLSKLHISSCLGKSSGPVCSVTAFFTSHWPRTSPEPIKQTASPETSSSMRGDKGTKANNAAQPSHGGGGW